MVDALATVALETLRDLLVEEVRFLSSVSDEVKQVERDLKTMHSLLMDMDADKWRSDRYNRSTLENCVADLKNLALEAENVLEKYAFDVTSKKEGSNLKKKLKRFACILSECFSVYQVGKEIDDIRSRLSDLTKRLGSMSRGEGLSNLAEDEQLRYLSRLKYAHEIEIYFVGMDDDIKRIISMVKDDRRRSPVISICGMGGLGKTTLARKIYHHQEVRSSFEARAWVCVTQKFGAKSVLSQILEQLAAGDVKGEMDAEDLVVKINGVLMVRKCLIVVDDIWEKDHWNILKQAFQRNCKVVLTTRNENIVSQECVYKLGLLSEDQGWELLQKIAILNDDDPPEVLETRSRSLEDIGRQMVQKCGRLPLAISMIGGILRQKQTLAEWENVSSNIDSYLKHGEGVGNDTGVKQVLDLSYDVLPYYLKPCFLYLGSFPEDEEIKPLKLYLLWISEGLISSEDRGRNETLMDVAERYLSELAFRCMVQVQKNWIYTPCNKFWSCRLHDLIHDLCSAKAEEEKFVKRVDLNKHPHNISSSADHTSINRLAICIDDVATTLSINGIEKIEDLRSFLVWRNWSSRRVIYFRDGTINFDKSKCLRILTLEGCEFEGKKLPSKIDKLIHLRCLSLNCSDVEELPPFVCKMPYLQTLDLRVSDSIKLPNVICKMKRLKHLFLGRFEVIGGGKLILEGLNELETLEKISSNKVRVADICKLTSLHKLVIVVDDMDSLSMIAHHMRNNDQCQLRDTHLTVVSCSFSSEEGTNVLTNVLMSPSLVEMSIEQCEISCGFPCYQQGMCKNLVRFILFGSKIEGDVMESLGKYPALQEVNLFGEGLVKAEVIFGPHSFPELKSLYMEFLPNLMKWEVAKRAMPRLTKLEISHCLNLEMIPDGLRFISSLREFRSIGMPKEFNDRLRVDVDGQQGEDYYKVCHIPSIKLYDMKYAAINEPSKK